jgi:hypothetical protein
MPQPELHLRNIAICLGLFAVVLGVHGALPFVAIPTLGQALWITGFGESFIRGGIFNLYAHNFGCPLPAPIVFGLPGAWPAGLLIGAGLHPGDAYALVLWLWLAIASWGATRVGRLLGLQLPAAALGATTWLTLPVVWNHAHYSMLSMGFALLPAYVLAPLALVRRPPVTRPDFARLALHYALMACIAVFMDGYTFVMFAVAATALLLGHVRRDGVFQRQVLRFVLPLHVFSLALAVLLYRAYVGRAEFTVEPMEAFRGWGADLRFLAVPTRGTHWLLDALGWSEPRTTIEQFGDASVWQTTFVLPLLLAGALAWWRVRTRGRLALICLALSLFGGYMALGPSLKFGHTRPPTLQAQHDPLMPRECAGPRTGTSLLSKHLPGFKNMRASYRWMGLCALGLWLLLLLWLAQPGARWRYAVILGIIALNLPHPIEKWRTAIDYRDNLRQLDHAVVDALRVPMRPQERVIFLPFGNDFIINYLASRLDLRAYNIGGDKNLAMARAHWPAPLPQFEMGKVDAAFGDRIAAVLHSPAVADVVIIPHFDMLWAAHHWPCGEQHLAKCPEVIARDLADTEHALQQRSDLTTVVAPLFTTVRASP